MENYKSLEHIIRNISEADRNTEARRKVVNVGRPDTAPSNTDDKSKLAKQGEIKTKIIEAAADTADGMPDEDKDKAPKKDKKDKSKDSKSDDKSDDTDRTPEEKVMFGKTEVDTDPKTDDRANDDTKEKAASKKARTQANKEIGAKTMKEDKVGAFGLPLSLIDAVTEALKGNQKKLDKNHNNKLDKEDFKLLRKEENIEEDEQLDEISKELAGRYAKKAHSQSRNATARAVDAYHNNLPKTQAYHSDKSNKREAGMRLAIDKLSGKAKVPANEEALDEVSKGAAIRAYGATQDPDRDDSKTIRTGERLKKHIVRKFGAKTGEHAERHASASHYGRDGHSTGTDRLASAKPSSEMRKTKSGKIHGQDVASKKSEIKFRNTMSKFDKPKGHLPEDVEQIDEVRTMSSSGSHYSWMNKPKITADQAKRHQELDNEARKRQKAIDAAKDAEKKTAKEEVEQIDEISHGLALKAMKKSEKRSNDEFYADQTYDRLSDWQTHQDRADRLRSHMRKKFGNDKPGRGETGGDRLKDRKMSDRLTHGKRAGMPSAKHKNDLKGSIKGSLGQHKKANLPEDIEFSPDEIAHIEAIMNKED